MLVPFVIEADALAGEERWTTRELRGHHEALLRAWKRIGLFVFDGQHLGNSALRQFIDASLEGSVMHGLWRGFVERAPSIPGGDKWPGAINEVVIPGLAEVARVCFTKDAAIDQFDAAAQAADLELLTIAGAGGCRGFAAGEQKAAAGIDQGESVRSVWLERFAPLAAARTDKLKNIYVSDPYSVERHIAEGKEGLARFLSLLSETAQSRKNVTVYAKWPYRDNQRVSRELIIASLRQMRVNHDLGSISKFSVVLGNNAEQFPRERFIMFGETYVWEIGHVLEVFDAAIVTKKHNASLKTWESTEFYGKWLDDLQANERLEIW